MTKRIGLFFSLLALFLLAACGGKPAPEASLTITSPSDNAIVHSEKINVQGSVNDATRQIRYVVNDADEQSLTLENNNFSFEATLKPGENTIKVTGVAGSNTKEETITVNYQEKALITVISPSNNSTVNMDKIPVHGVIHDTVDAIHYTVNDGAETKLTIAAGSNSFNFEAALKSGENTIKVKATSGTRSTESIVKVTYQTALGGPVLTDADLAAAPLIDPVQSSNNTSLRLSPQVSLSLTQDWELNLEAASEGPFLPTPSSQTADLETQGVNVTLNDAGTAVYVQEDPSLGEGGTRIVAVNMNDGSKSNIYEGMSAIESVAVTTDGNFFLFTAKHNGNYQVFGYGKTDDVFGFTGLRRLTDTSGDESHVSLTNTGHLFSWQGTGTAQQQTMIVAVLVGGKLATVPITVRAGTVLPITQPALSGNGRHWVGVSKLGSTLLLVVQELDQAPSAAYIDPKIEALLSPSYSLDGSLLIFAEKYEGQEYISRLQGSRIARLPVSNVQSIHTAANGSDFIYAQNGNIMLADFDNIGGHTISLMDGLVDRSAYWARATLATDRITSYLGTNATGQTFIRPDDNTGLTDAQRTVQYHTHEFVAAESSHHRIDSFQNYDGFLSLYKGSFDPANPSTNLLGQNDDFRGSFSPGPPPSGNSAVFAALTKGQKYVIVTSAYAAPPQSDASVGNFTNNIQAGVEPPPPPIQLPTPDNSQYDITVIFEPETDRKLTAEQKKAFTDAAARWEAIITKDLEDIPVNLPFNTFFPDTPGIVGTVDDTVIMVRFRELSDGLLGQAGPRLIRTGANDKNLPITGIMEFNINEFREGGFFSDKQRYEDVIVHEMAHVIGIGTLWSLTGNVDSNYIASNPPTVDPGLPNPNYNPGFTGTRALAQYKLLVGTNEDGTIPTVVPIANTGGPGNYNGHWREIVFKNELMTPYAGGSELLSKMTAASLGDIGYTVDMGSSAIDTNYQMVRQTAVLKQVEPASTKVYEEFKDFAVFNGSSAGDVTALVQAVDLSLDQATGSTSGCEAADFANFTAGNIALLRRGACTFVTKVTNAKNAGAVAVVMFNEGNEDTPARKNYFIGGSNAENMPVVGTSYDIGVAFANTANLKLRVAVTRQVGPFNNDGISTSAFRPTLPIAPIMPFNEVLLYPIGTIDANGKVTDF